MTAPDAQPPAVYWSPSQGWLWPDADGRITSLDMGELATWGRNLPADAVRLVPADTLKRAERRAGHCNGRELNPPCGYCEAVRQCERCELIAASKPWLRPAAALAGTTTPTANVVALLLEACRDAEDNRPPCDCAGPPDFGDGIYGSHEGDCTSYEFPAVQASYIRELLASTPTTEDPS